MSLLFLNTDNFSISKGERGSLLCNGIEGFSLILYYNTKKQFSQGDFYHDFPQKLFLPT